MEAAPMVETEWLGAPLLPFEEADWKKIAEALGPRAEVTTLPDGTCVPDAFRKVISLLIKRAAGTDALYSREVANEAYRGLQGIARAALREYQRRSPQAQELMRDREFSSFIPELLQNC